MSVLSSKLKNNNLDDLSISYSVKENNEEKEIHFSKNILKMVQLSVYYGMKSKIYYIITRGTN